MKRVFAITGLAVLASLLLAACATPTPPPPVTVIQTVVVTQALPAAPTMAPAPTPVTQVPADALAEKGKLLICTFSLGTTYGSDPYATYLLDGLVQYIVSGPSPTLEIPLSAP